MPNYRFSALYSTQYPSQTELSNPLSSCLNHKPPQTPFDHPPTLSPRSISHPISLNPNLGRSYCIYPTPSPRLDLISLPSPSLNLGLSSLSYRLSRLMALPISRSHPHVRPCTQPKPATVTVRNDPQTFGGGKLCAPWRFVARAAHGIIALVLVIGGPTIRKWRLMLCSAWREVDRSLRQKSTNLKIEHEARGMTGYNITELSRAMSKTY